VVHETGTLDAGVTIGVTNVASRSSVTNPVSNLDAMMTTRSVPVLHAFDGQSRAHDDETDR
jgi:hypothetical protein